MSETKFTKGEWNVYRMGNYFGIDSGYEPDNKTIVTFGDGDDDLCGVRGETVEEMYANARLIAAAPKLYEALKEIAEMNTENNSVSPFQLTKLVERIREKANAALTSATEQK